MPSQRRIRLLFLAIFAGVILTLVYTSHVRSTEARDGQAMQDFYHRTVDALDRHGGASSGGGSAGDDGKNKNKKPPPGQAVLDAKTGNSVGHAPSDRDADGDVDEDDRQLAREMTDRLRAAEQQAKDQANQKAPLKPEAPSEVIGVGSAAGGHRKEAAADAAGAGAASSGAGAGAAAGTGKDAGKAREKAADELAGAGIKAAKGQDGEETSELTEEEHEAEAVLETILKRSPVVIFSKTYCQFSKRAKGLLLEKYLIEPEPHVVELDTHPLGPRLQARLAARTGRRTVPNILVHGVSIGGSDDVAEMDNAKTLAAKIESLGKGKVEVRERFVKAAAAAEGAGAEEHLGHARHGGTGRDHDES